MTIVDVFTIATRGVVVVGPFVGPLPHTGDPLVVTDQGHVVASMACVGIEDILMADRSSRRFGVLLGDITSSAIRAGQVLTLAT